LGEIISTAIRLLVDGGAPIWAVVAMALLAAVLMVLGPKAAAAAGKVFPGGGPVRQPGDPTWEDDHPASSGNYTSDPENPGGDCKSG
jgi:hypothetical protein